MAMAVSIYGTLCVLVLFEKAGDAIIGETIYPLILGFGNKEERNADSQFFDLRLQVITRI